MLLNGWNVSRLTRNGMRVTGNVADNRSAAHLDRLWHRFLDDRFYDNNRDTVETLLNRVGLGLDKVRPIGK